MAASPLIYVGPTGWEVKEFSHSQYQAYRGCPKRFEFERIRGWKQRPGAALELGKGVEQSVRLFFQEQREPVETFEASWEPLKENEKLQYPERETFETFKAAGVGLMKKFRATMESFPPRNPVWPSFRNPLKVRDERTGVFYQTIPDLIDSDEKGKFIADLKCMGNLVDDTVPGMIVNDQQLRTQAHVTKIYRVALWNFCRKPKNAPSPTKDEILSTVKADEEYKEMLALYVAHETCGGTFKECGEILGIANPEAVNKKFKKTCEERTTLKAMGELFAEEIKKNHKRDYIIQWVEGQMTPEHAQEAIAEECSVVPLIQAKYFPRIGGVRFPNNECTWCSHRGLCMEELHGPREEYSRITSEELVRFDADAMSEL
jgi:hypothetical protein